MTRRSPGRRALASVLALIAALSFALPCLCAALTVDPRDDAPRAAADDRCCAAEAPPSNAAAIGSTDSCCCCARSSVAAVTGPQPTYAALAAPCDLRSDDSVRASLERNVQSGAPAPPHRPPLILRI